MSSILVIDDDEIIRNVLNKTLVREGYHVELAGNGKEGLTMLDKMHYDLVITDLMMPYANGFEVIGKLKQHPNTADAAIIVVSSVNNEDSIIDGFKLGIDEYIRKPVIIGELLMHVKKLLSKNS